MSKSERELREEAEANLAAMQSHWEEWGCDIDDLLRCHAELATALRAEAQADKRRAFEAGRDGGCWGGGASGSLKWQSFEDWEKSED